MTFSDPFAHSLPLFSDLHIPKLDNICENNLAPNHFRDYFTQVSDIHHHNTRSASHGNFFLKRKNTLHYGLCSGLMEQKFGITSLLISETLHQLETSRKRSHNCFWSLVTQKFIMHGNLYHELGVNLLRALCLLLHIPFGSSRLQYSTGVMKVDSSGQAF